MFPIMLAGAGAAVLSIPVVIHFLLRQQPKKFVFPALRFLQQRQKTSSRRVQLKHIVLLILRSLLLALFALALFQPTLSTGGGPNPFGDEPVAAVIVVDTSPSMGYRTGQTSRLDEARRRASELLDQLPQNSKVAVLPTHDPTGSWQPTLLEAAQRIESFKEPSGSAQPLGTALSAAYDLLATADEDHREGTEPMVKLVAVFGDCIASSWDLKDVGGLKGKRDSLPEPPTQLYFDVGVEDPQNLAVAELTMESDRLSGAADAVVTAMIRSDGIDAPNLVVSAQLDGNPKETQLLDLTRGQWRPVVFTFRQPAPGFHSVRVKIERENPDALPFDNERTITFEVQPRRKILAIADRPSDITFWKDAHNFGRQEFECQVVTPDNVPPLGQFEMVAVIAVADPGPFALTVREYVERGGKLFLVPDGPNSESDPDRAVAYDSLVVLPAPLGEVKQFPPIENWAFGRPWQISEEQDLRHPFFAPIREWQKLGNVDIFRNPRITAKYRELKSSDALVIAKYVGGDAPPALVERTFGQGTVLMLTTRLDNATGDKDDFWNDFWVRENSSWTVVFPWLVTKYLCDQASDTDTPSTRRYNFLTGDEVKIGVRGFAPTNGDRKLRLEGPGVSAASSTFTLPADVSTLTLRDRRTDGGRTISNDVWELEGEPLLTPGEFALYPNGVASPWESHFSISIPPSESTLQPLPEESVSELFGPESVIPLDRQVRLEEVIELRQKNTFELFPALMLLVLIFFAVEGYMANRFYKLK